MADCVHVWSKVENSEGGGKVMLTCTRCGTTRQAKVQTESKAGRRVLTG